MIAEQIEKRLNFFERLGSNVHDFSDESILEAVTENYNVQKHADVICTESAAGTAMFPAIKFVRCFLFVPKIAFCAEIGYRLISKMCVS